MKKKTAVFISWLLVVVCMTAIFMLSSQSGESSAELSGATIGFVGRIINYIFGEDGHTAFRKTAHFLEYAGLAFLLYNAFYQTRTRKRLSPYLPYISAVLYAVTDEVHQYFVEGRACRLFDVGIDALGAIVGMTVFFIIASYVAKKSCPEQ